MTPEVNPIRCPRCGWETPWTAPTMVESEVHPCKLVPLEKVVRYHLTCDKRGCGLVWDAEVLWEEADECVRRARCASSLARSIVEEHTRPSCYRTQVEVVNLDVYTAHNCVRG